MISVISPIYNEARTLKELVERICGAIEPLGESFEIILVENGSRDDSLAVIRELRKKDRRVKLLSLSRNFGHQGAIMAGLAKASGEAVISLDGDLQHPPELIPLMIKRWRQGAEVVCTQKKESTATKGLRAFFSKYFYKVFSFMSGIPLAYGQSDFRLLDRAVVDVLLSVPERRKFIRGLVEWVGFEQCLLDYEPAPRKEGESKFSLWAYLSFAVDGIFSFSNRPLRLFFWFGMFVASLCIMYAVAYFLVGLINWFYREIFELPPGWATIAVSVAFLSAVQLMGIGILGEYIGRIFRQVKGRPEFIVKHMDLEGPSNQEERGVSKQLRR